MQTLDLPLFETSDSVLNENTPGKEVSPTQTYPTHPLKPLEDALKGIVPQNAEENTISKTRRLLGDKAKALSDEQIHCLVTEFQFLINTWLDEFEKDIFNGMTLKEVLNEQ